MHGYILLAEGRSGSSWLGTLTDSTGVMGKSNEWISQKLLGLRMKDHSKADYVAEIVKRASTENGRFAIKIFPRHLFEFAEVYGDDFIDVLRAEHGVSIFHLEREDTVRQAISFLRGTQTRQWDSNRVQEKKATYDFSEVARCLFYIEESKAFWRSYLKLRDMNQTTFVYEDLVGDPSPFVDAVARALDVEAPSYSTSYEIQRDNITEEWVARLRQDLRSSSPLGSYSRQQAIKPSLKNVIRLLRGRLKGLRPFLF